MSHYILKGAGDKYTYQQSYIGTKFFSFDQKSVEKKVYVGDMSPSPPSTQPSCVHFWRERYRINISSYFNKIN